VLARTTAMPLTDLRKGKVSKMATQSVLRDSSRFTMIVLEAALARGDPSNTRVAANAMLRSAFTHLYFIGFHENGADPGIGQARCELLVLTGERP
jgi:hypothetical protein